MLPIPLLPLCYPFMLGLSALSTAALAGGYVPERVTPPIQSARYSVIYPQPTPEQHDLLASTAPRRVPDEIATVGGAVDWALKPAGYRLVTRGHLSDEAKDLLNLPLPDAHRQFDALPVRDVLALLVGPAFRVVQDPIHRLISVERCRSAASPTEREVSGMRSTTENSRRAGR
jgi:conjugative transfer region protein (TIGR03748 family)